MHDLCHHFDIMYISFSREREDQFERERLDRREIDYPHMLQKQVKRWKNTTPNLTKRDKKLHGAAT